MRTIIALAMILTASAANAQEAFASMGVGSQSCGQFAQHYQQDVDSELYYFSWAQGFMTAANISLMRDQHRYRDLAGRSTIDQRASIRSYCNDHPLSNFADAVIALFITLPVKESR
jgi:hypothetical protein